MAFDVTNASGNIPNPIIPRVVLQPNPYGFFQDIKSKPPMITRMSAVSGKYDTRFDDPTYYTA